MRGKEQSVSILYFNKIQMLTLNMAWNFLANKPQINSRDKSRDASHTTFKNIAKKNTFKS